ncbi:MAG: hypothetical protein C4539_08925 [Ignavibacteriales bacterium]|nr:MAG: hypothetical protein C4539_08925 [Ignavibacteriales bacterium]
MENDNLIRSIIRIAHHDSVVKELIREAKIDEIKAERFMIKIAFRFFKDSGELHQGKILQYLCELYSKNILEIEEIISDTDPKKKPTDKNPSITNKEKLSTAFKRDNKKYYEPGEFKRRFI